MLPSSLLERPTPAEGATGQVVHVGRHVLGLAVVLLALLPIFGRDGLFSADEGAALAQTRLLSEDRGWLLDHPLPQIDPENEAFPLEYSSLTDRVDGRPAGSPFAKHPAYVIGLVPFDRAAGTRGVILASLLGTVLAAAAAGLLTRRVVPAWAGAAVWATGLGTPLFFDSWIVIAHTLGAGLVGCAALAVVRAHEGKGTAPILTAAAAIAGAVLLRNEANLFGVALAMATLVLAWRSRRRVTALAGVAVLVGTVVGHLVDGMLEAAVAGDGMGTFAAGVRQSGFLAGRVSGAAVTLLRPSYGTVGLPDAVLLVTVLALIGSVVLARRRPVDRDGVRLFAGLAIAAAVARMFLGLAIVPGLFVAAPGIAAGLVAVRRRLFDADVPLLLGLTAGLFTGAVLATQYAEGGSAEWGGRYFAIALPLVVPLVLAGLHALVADLDGGTRRTLLGAFVVVSLALTLLGARSLVAVKDGTHELVERVESAGVDLDEPVVLATNGTPGRAAWHEVLAGAPWLLVAPADVDDWLDRVGDEGRDVVVVTQDLDEIRAAVDRWPDADGREPTSFLGWWVVPLHHP